MFTELREDFERVRKKVEEDEVKQMKKKREKIRLEILKDMGQEK